MQNIIHLSETSINISKNPSWHIQKSCFVYPIVQNLQILTFQKPEAIHFLKNKINFLSNWLKNESTYSALLHIIILPKYVYLLKYLFAVHSCNKSHMKVILCSLNCSREVLIQLYYYFWVALYIQVFLLFSHWYKTELKKRSIITFRKAGFIAGLLH